MVIECVVVEKFTAVLITRRSPAPCGAKCSGAESSESRALALSKSCARQSAVFGAAVQSKAQPHRNEKRSRSELTRQSPQSVGASSAAVAIAQPQNSRV
jgi:hypothetical protein